MLSDVQGKSRIYTGFLMMPVAFFSDTSAMIPNDYYLTGSSAMTAAIEEAASLVYDPNSSLYHALDAARVRQIKFDCKCRSCFCTRKRTEAGRDGYAVVSCYSRRR